VLPVLVVAALAVLPPSAPLTDLPPGADPCIALAPAVVDQLRTSGALTRLVPDEVSTATLIAVGRSLTGCPPTRDPDPATVRRHVCPLLTAQGVGVLADHLGASPAVRADLGPERIAIARNSLQCDHPAATTSAATTAGPARDSSNTADHADRGLLQGQELTVISFTAAIAALIGVLLLMVVVRPHKRRREGGSGASGHPQVLQPQPRATGAGRQQASDDRDRRDDQQRATPAGDSDTHVRPEDHSNSYDELLEGLRREVTQLQRADEASRKRSTEPDSHGEH
jgi:hypothetical protein